MKLEPDTTYYVQSEEDETVMLAMDARLHDGLVEWFDTVRDRCFEVKSTEVGEGSLTVHTEGPSYRIRILTLDIYNDRVAGNVVGSRSFSSTEDLQQFYRDFPR